MAMEQNFFEPEAQFELDGDASLKQKWRSIPSPKKVSENDNGSFECNICLDSANDPVVTLCGHLYCWPCIYKWLQVQCSSDVEPDQKNCPVCKANISHASLIPLYGRGTSCSDSEAKKPNLDLVIPRRPPPVLNTIITSTTSHPNQQLHPNYFQSQSQSFHQPYFPHSYGAYAANMSSSNLGGASILFNPTIGMFGELVFSRIFGSSDTNLFPQSPMNSYPSTGSGSPRIRRHEMQFDKSLNRVSIFLFCCLILCLLSF